MKTKPGVIEMSGAKVADDITAQDIFRMLAERYKERPDDFSLLIGHVALPFPELPVSIINLPEIQGFMSLEMRYVRKWAALSTPEPSK